MKTIYLFLLVSLISLSGFGQSTLGSAYHIKEYSVLTYNPLAGTQAQTGPDYGCLTSLTNRPVWFYFTPCGMDSAVLPTMRVSWQLAPDSIGYFGMIIWGPFDDTINIANRLTAAKIDTCIMDTAGKLNWMYFPFFQPAKFYIGMICMADTVQFGGLDAIWLGDWMDGRCGICNSRVTNYKQDICMVTLDTTTQKNMVVWEKKNNFGTESFNIYRESSVAGKYDSIGNVPVTNNGMFIDQAVNPNQKSYKYKMSARDSCGATALKYNQFSDTALVHETIHLQASPGLSGEVNLAWNAYIGFSYSTFYIYRGNAANNLQILDSVSASTFAYTDYTAKPGLNYYKVSVKNAAGCSPDGGVTTYYQARSNNPYTTLIGIDELNNSLFINISPNPLTSSSILQLNALINQINQWSEVVIYDMVGKEMLRKKLTGNKTEIEKGSLAAGVYFVRVTAGERQRVEKLIIE